MDLSSILLQTLICMSLGIVGKYFLRINHFYFVKNNLQVNFKIIYDLSIIFHQYIHILTFFYINRRKYMFYTNRRVQ